MWELLADAPPATAVTPPTTTLLFCRLCRKQFSHPLALLQHVQHVHQIKIFEMEKDYTTDKDPVAAASAAGAAQRNTDSASASDGVVVGTLPVE